MTTNFPLDAHQDSITLAQQAHIAYARGCALRVIDAEESQEAFLQAWDYANAAGLVCGRHDLPAPFALTQLPPLMAAFEEGEADGCCEREQALEAQVDLFEEAA